MRTFFLFFIFSVLREQLCFKFVDRFFFFFSWSKWYIFSVWTDVMSVCFGARVNAARNDSTADLCEHLNTSGLLNNTLHLLFYSSYPCYSTANVDMRWLDLVYWGLFSRAFREMCAFSVLKKLIQVNVFSQDLSDKECFFKLFMYASVNFNYWMLL